MIILAEVGSVHDGSFGNARKLIELARSSGADAVKFQTHIASAETLRLAPAPSYFTSEPRYEYFERTAFTRDQWKALKRHADDMGIEFISSPFSIPAVDLLEEVGVVRYKIPSGEVTNLPLLETVAKTGKPILLSSGMSSWKELDAAVQTIRRHHDRLTLLQCTSEYPCPEGRVGLNILEEIRKRYGTPMGISDHTLTNYAALAAVALGATVVEKHLTFSRRMYGSDAPHSLEPDEFSDLVRGIRSIERMLAHPVDKDDIGRWTAMKAAFEKSVVSLVGIPRGTPFTPALIGTKKPGTGISAARFAEILGCRAARDIPADQLLTEQDIEWGSHA